MSSSERRPYVPEDSFTLFYRRHREATTRTALLYGALPVDAEDVTQEVMVRAWARGVHNTESPTLGYM